MARRTQPVEGETREVIVDAARRLLDTRAFGEISVADILGEAAVSRGTFYFYFSGKHDVLAELMQQAIAAGHESARTWLTHDQTGDREAAVRSSIESGARLWAEHAPVLRAVVENWHADPKLGELWRTQMAGFTASTAARIEADGGAGPGIDTETLAATLTWLGERLYYLAAIGVPPFDDRERLVGALTHVWMSALYR